MLEANLRWSQCKDCQIYHPKNWEIDHGCTAKGQLASECLLGVIDFPKTNKKFDKFLPKNPNLNHKIKALYNVFILLILPLFRFKGRNLSKF